MFSELDLYFVAINSKSKSAQAEIVSLGTQMQEALALNEHLHEEIWDQLYKRLTAVDSEYLGKLLINAPTQQQLCAVAPTAPEDQLEVAMELGMKISPELAGVILKRAEGADSDGLAYHLLCSGYAPLELLPSLLARVEQAYGIYDSYGSGIAHFTIIALATKYDYLSDGEVVSLLERIKGDISFTVSLIVDQRPSVIKTALESLKKERYLPAVATSRHLTAELAAKIYQELIATNKTEELSFQTAKALTQNPNAPYDIRAAAARYILSDLREHAEPELATTIQLAAAEYQEWFDSGLPPVTSPWELADEYDLPRVRYAIKQTGTQFYPTLSTSIPSIRDMYWFEEESANKKILTEEIEPYLDSLGQNAWTIFLSLLPNWQDTTDSLLQATTHLARDGYKK